MTGFTISDPAQPENPNRHLGVVDCALCMLRHKASMPSTRDSTTTSCRFGFSPAEAGRNHRVTHTTYKWLPRILPSPLLFVSNLSEWADWACGMAVPLMMLDRLQNSVGDFHGR